MWSGAASHTSEALTKGPVYGSFIFIRIVDPGNRTRCELFHLRGVVSVAGHFVHAAGGYPNVDPCWNICFVARAGTCGLKCVIPMKQLTKIRRTRAKHSPDQGNSTGSLKASGERLEKIRSWKLTNGRDHLFRRACLETPRHRPEDCCRQLLPPHQYFVQPAQNIKLDISEWSSGPHYGHSVKIYVCDADTWKIRLEYVSASGVPR